MRNIALCAMKKKGDVEYIIKKQKMMVKIPKRLWEYTENALS